MARALEVEWHDGVVIREKGWRNLDAVIARAQGISLVQELTVHAFEAIWRVRDPDGCVAYYMIPRR
jgi:hypothetical protein